MAVTLVGLADPQAGHRPPAQRGYGVDRLARGYPGKAPAGPGAQVAGALRHDRDIGAEHMAGREQPGVHRHRLQVPAEGLPGGDRRGQPAGLFQRRAGAGEPGGQRAAILHDVDHADAMSGPGAGPAGSFGRIENAGQHGRERRVQVGHHDRHPADVIRVAEHLVVRRALLVGAGHHGLQRGVAGLDQVAGQLRVGRQAVRDGDDQGVSAGTEREIERRGIQQHPVAGQREPGQCRVGQRPHRRPVHQYVKLDRAWPLPPRAADRAVPPCDHAGSLQAAGTALAGRQ